jgi:large conductance mechanosensitive channel
MTFFNDFKKFAMRGNVLDMAVGVVIGAAFGKIISSFVSNILMPPLGLLVGRMDFSNLFIDLSGQSVHTLAEAQAANVPVIAYGLFLNAVIDFTIVAFAIFLLLRQINRFYPKPEPEIERKCPYCFSVIAEKATRCPHCTSEI